MTDQLDGFYYSQSGGWFSLKWAEQFCGGGGVLKHAQSKMVDAVPEPLPAMGIKTLRHAATATQLVSASQPAESIVDDGSAELAGAGRGKGRWA